MRKKIGVQRVRHPLNLNFDDLSLMPSKFIALNEALKADHGFNTDSRAIRNLIDILSSYDTKSRRDLLQFITGSPRLPVGGTLTDPSAKN
jgi:hypothetical protein